MKHKRFALVSLLPLLFSCAGANVDLNYVQELNANGDEDFVVLQLTDIHWNYSTNIKEASAYLNNTIKVAKNDIIRSNPDPLHRSRGWTGGLLGAGLAAARVLHRVLPGAGPPSPRKGEHS